MTIYASTSGMIKPVRYALAGLLFANLLSCAEQTDRPDPYALMEGEGVYKAECASCHGKKLEGQATWQVRGADGKLPAPPHDASGHTWHHSTEQLFSIVKFGLVPPNAPEGYRSDMPAYGNKLSDRQINNVLLYIENQWPAEIRAKRKAQFGK